jgi:bifunctional DNA-binding transcriptional regulator/antitoxin component of YhaV-PrlF toxin-antitoxin module
MARNTLENRYIRKVIKGTSSYLMTFPIEYIRALGWRDGQKIVADLDEEKQQIIIRDWKPKR